METTDVLQRVRRIEIKTRALTNNIFAGEYHSAFKGRGMSFAEVREYQPGDEVRDIDWNVTARLGRPYVKTYEEERELTVVLLVDVSASLDFGSEMRTQREMMTEVAATIAFSAMQNNDKVGVVFFSDHIEKFIPPKKGRKHILHIIRELIDFHPTHHKTDIGQGVEFLTRAISRHCISFLISDFLDPKSGDLSHLLTIANKKHDMVAIQIYDKRMKDIPDVGIIKVADAEIGEEQYIDTSSAKVRAAYSQWWIEEQEKLQSLLKKCGIDYVSISTGEDYVKALMMLFNKRIKF